MIARLRLILLRCLRGPATREEKTPRCDCNWFRATGKSRT